jgi:hypothetical protein
MLQDDLVDRRDVGIDQSRQTLESIRFFPGPIPFRLKIDDYSHASAIRCLCQRRSIEA